MAYSKELEAVIDAALADGVITEKERAVLHKKALLEGVDPDELDVVIEGRLAKMKREVDWLRPTPPKNLENEKRGNVVKCPNCGATIEAGSARCAECGYVFTNVKSNNSSEKLAAKLEELVHKSYKCESDRGEAMANVIRNFPVPTAKEDMIEFISSMLPKTFQTTDNQNESAYYLPSAYLAKVEECILKAKVTFPDDPQLQSLIKIAEKTKFRRLVANFTHSAGFWFALMFILMFLVLGILKGFD